MHRIPLLTKTALAALFVFVLFALLLPLGDPDYFWHLKTGEYIVAHRALPDGDVFSFTWAGQPWVLHEWLFEVILYGVYAAAGEDGVAALTVGLALCAFGLAFASARRLGGGSAPAWVASTLGGFAFVGGMTSRPQLLTYLFLALILKLLLAFKYRRAARGLLLLPLVMVFWVNAHGAYVIGIALMLLFAGCETLAWACRPLRDAAQGRRLALLACAIGLSVLATLANPGMFERWLYPFQVVGMQANTIIQEWGSPNFHDFKPKAYLALVLLFLVSAAYAAREPDLTELVLPLSFAVLGFISVRHLPLATLVLLPFTAQALGRGPLAGAMAWLRGRAAVRWYLTQRGDARELDRRAEQLMNWGVACLIVLCLPVLVRAQQTDEGRPGKSELPVGAADYIAAHGLEGRLFNAYDDGGYLIWRLAPRVRVAIDGRADMYGDRFVIDYQKTYAGAASWQAQLERLAPDLALLPLDAPIRQLLLAQGRFREVYRDRQYAVLQRSNPAVAAAR